MQSRHRVERRPTLVITLRARSVTFYQADGSWRTYSLTGRRERHGP